ncbi:MAG: pyrroline-5-carboxylate reductase [Oscillospiraceae bacterium]|nr:pyrroline-5-carboxylate reductase [Oscillospiraceae bacterium]
MKYGFIGCGNMGGAIARALSLTTKDILVTDRTGRAKVLAAELGIAYGSAGEAALCSRVFLAVKPQMMERALLPLQDIFAEKKPLLISMAAGLTTQRIAALAGCDLPIIRIMPNTPVAVGKGTVLYCCNSLVTEEQLALFLEDMAPCGQLEAVSEALFDPAGTVSGCGPAYCYMFLEAMADGAVACGVPREQALQFAAATMAGAAEMVLKTGQHPEVLKDAVCSPGGSTIAGVRKLEEKGMRSAVAECIVAACQRNRELGK